MRRIKLEIGLWNDEKPFMFCSIQKTIEIDEDTPWEFIEANRLLLWRRLFLYVYGKKTHQVVV